VSSPARALAIGLAAAALALVPAAARAQDWSRDPVLFVHGHGLGAWEWIGLTATLVARGHPPELLRAIDLSPSTGANGAAAETQIALAVEAFLADVNATLAAAGQPAPPKTRVDLVSHSMGAVSTRYYAALVAPHRVDAWIALAGANHGTDAACPYVGWDDGGAAELCPAYSTDPEDTVQLLLNGAPGAGVDETPFGLGADAPGVAAVVPDDGRRIFYATIRTEPDAWIVPADSAMVDGAGGRPLALPAGLPAVETTPGNFVMTHGVDHDAMPSDFWVQQLVLLLLDAVDPPPPPPPPAPPGRMSGRGHVDEDGLRHHFRFRARASAGGIEAGRLEYLAVGDGVRRWFVSTAVTAVVFADDAAVEPGPRPASGVDTVRVHGIGRWNGTPGYAFEARAQDGGEPGRGRDGFALTVTAPDGRVVARVDGRLGGGNVQSRRLRP
jgi:hypothetical protein